MYLELLHGIEKYFEMCRSSLVDVNFETQEGSARDAEICVLRFLFVKVFGDTSTICTLTRYS
jgi:hypothetical protein